MIYFKFIITTAIFLNSIFVFSQKKVETTTWIKDKLGNYGGTQEAVYQNVYFVGCKVFYREQNSGSPYTFSKHFDASATQNWTINANGIQADSNIIESRNDYNFEIEYTDQIDIRDKENVIKKEMIKALLHLASFCETDKNENV